MCTCIYQCSPSLTNKRSGHIYGVWEISKLLKLNELTEMYHHAK